MTLFIAILLLNQQGADIGWYIAAFIIWILHLGVRAQ